MRRMGILIFVLFAFVLVLGLAGFNGAAAPIALSRAAPAAAVAQAAASQTTTETVSPAAPPATAAQTAAAADLPNAPDTDLLESAGKVSFLRVHDVGTGYGPPSDFLDVEVVAQLNTQPGKAFGFQLRTDTQQAARQGMLDLLRDAFNNNWTVLLDYYIDPGKNNGRIIRVALQKP